ncbi:Transposase-like protein [Corynebacterium vitaeruminis DSM 20294]|uniref:Transposase-like protein n=1 Tax=Corynebacterium vitaeruminis DSM 20294 TaxID=1224164 RepID=W5Y2J8_9CORY|nr:Transposase-like protein [Corynebacterium vitaeruminis DSM 20294]
MDRNFHVPAPNMLWVADITYVRTHVGWVYTAFITDAYSRRIVGWKVSAFMYTDLVVDTLTMAIDARCRAGQRIDQLIHHSDRGVQYRGECLMVCVWVPDPHKEIDQNDDCGTTRPSR